MSEQADDTDECAPFLARVPEAATFQEMSTIDRKILSGVATPVLLLFLGLLSLIICFVPARLLAADRVQPSSETGTQAAKAKTVQLYLLGVVTFPTGYQFQGTEVGGLSGITYDPKKDCFYAVSDDRSRTNPARFYTLTIDLKDGRLDPGDISFTGVTTLLDKKGSAYKKGHVDPEAIAITSDGNFYIASEGDVKKHISPFINRFDPKGRQNKTLPVPDKFMPSAQSGVRNNLAFESLTITPDQGHLYTAVENALLQDGPKAGVGQNSLVRILKYDLNRGDAIAEYIYPVAEISEVHQISGITCSNGLAELLAVDNDGTLLALERGYAMGRGMTVKLYHMAFHEASNVIAEFALSAKGATPKRFSYVQKTEVLDVSQILPYVDNLEGMTFGPDLPDGRRTLVMVSDNNFSRIQKTQFIALAFIYQ